MLDKINNISASNEYGRTGNSNSFSNVLNSVYNKKADAYDSVNISPAMLYLTQIGWRLKEFKHTVNEKIYIVFVASDIEFQTTIDLTEFNNITKLDYRIVKEKNGDNWRSKIFLEITSFIEKIKYDMEPRIINFSGLNVFLHRIFDKNIYHEVTDEDTYLINDLLANTLPGIINEFEAMNNFLFIFVEKLTGIKLNFNKNDNYENKEPISIKRIKVLNV